jgi:lipoate-protein ligase A
VISGRNDLLVNGLKISGNAEHVYKNRVLHHGTLLFDSDLGNLGAAIKNDGKKYESRAVQSNRSQVGNISSFLKKKLLTDEFAAFLLIFILDKYNATHYFLTEKDWAQIEALSGSKFTSFEWLFGYSPAYLFQNRVEAGGKILEVELEVKQGLIAKCRIEGDLFSIGEATLIANQLSGKKHIYQVIKDGLRGVSPVIDEGVIYTFF